MDIEKIGRELMGSGKSEKIRSVADSGEAKRLSGMLDGAAVEAAARSGNAEALQGILRQVLSTEDGRKLAQQLSEAIK